MSGISKSEREALAQRDDAAQAAYYRNLSVRPQGVSPYPTLGSAPGTYDPGMDYPFGFDPEGYTGEPLLGPEPEEPKEERLPGGELEPPQSTDLFRLTAPGDPRARGTGYRNITAPSQWQRDERYVGGSEFGKSSLESFTGLLTKAMTGYSPKIGRQNISRFARVKQYPSLFDYV